MLSAIQSANLALRFLLELCLLVSVGSCGFHAVQGRVLQIAVAPVAALLVALVWGVWLASASASRLESLPLLALEVLLFLIAVAGLAAYGRPVLAWILGLTAVGNPILIAVWNQ